MHLVSCCFAVGSSGALAWGRFGTALFTHPLLITINGYCLKFLIVRYKIIQRMVWDRCGSGVVAVSDQCGGGVGAVWERCEGGVGAVWERCRSGVRAVWGRCESGVRAV